MSIVSWLIDLVLAIWLCWDIPHPYSAPATLALYLLFRIAGALIRIASQP